MVAVVTGSGCSSGVMGLVPSSDQPGWLLPTEGGQLSVGHPLMAPSM